VPTPSLPLDEALLSMQRQGEPPYEPNAQCFDAIVQVIEDRHVALEGSLPVSRRLSDLEHWLAMRESSSLADAFSALVLHASTRR